MKQKIKNIWQWIRGPQEPAFKAKQQYVEYLLSQRKSPTIHDMRRRYWGNNIEKVGSDSWAVWTPQPAQSGDICRTELGDFVMDEVEACGNPSDMYFCVFYKIEKEAVHA